MQNEKHNNERKIDSMALLKFEKNSDLRKSKKIKPQTGRKYLQNTYLIKDLCPK